MSDPKEKEENTEKTRTNTIETRGVGKQNKDDKTDAAKKSDADDLSEEDAPRKG